MSDKNKTPKETKCTMAFSHEQITEHETSPDMVKLFKDFIRTYHTDLSQIHEDFEYWMEYKLTDDCGDCSDEKKCSKCMKTLKEEMKDRKEY